MKIILVSDIVHRS